MERDRWRVKGKKRETRPIPRFFLSFFVLPDLYPFSLSFLEARSGNSAVTKNEFYSARNCDAIRDNRAGCSDRLNEENNFLSISIIYIYTSFQSSLMNRWYRHSPISEHNGITFELFFRSPLSWYFFHLDYRSFLYEKKEKEEKIFFEKSKRTRKLDGSIKSGVVNGTDRRGSRFASVESNIAN